MTVQEYSDYIAAGNPVVAGSEAHLFNICFSESISFCRWYCCRITIDILDILAILKMSNLYATFLCGKDCQKGHRLVRVPLTFSLQMIGGFDISSYI